MLLVDRYVASNAAYGAARLHQDAAGEFVAWVRSLEIDRFALPVPDHQLLLAVPRAVAAERAAHRERTERGRRRDTFESDAALQQRTEAVYAQLRGHRWLSPWTVLDGRCGRGGCARRPAPRVGDLFCVVAVGATGPDVAAASAADLLQVVAIGADHAA